MAINGVAENPRDPNNYLIASGMGFGWINALILPLSASSPVVSFTATPGNGQTVLSWTNPGDLDLAGVLIKYSTQGFPMLSTEGITLTATSGIAVGAGTYTHTDVVTGTTYYYSAFAYDTAGRYSTPRQVAAQPGEAMSSLASAGMPAVRTSSGPVRRPAVEASASRNLYAAAGGGLFAKSLTDGSGQKIYVPYLARQFTPGW